MFIFKFDVFKSKGGFCERPVGLAFSARVRKVLRVLGYGSVVEHSTRILTSARGSGWGSEASILQSGANSSIPARSPPRGGCGSEISASLGVHIPKFHQSTIQERDN